MPKKTFTPEQIVRKLRQIEVLVIQGKTVPLACKGSRGHRPDLRSLTEEYGGLQMEQAKKLKDLQNAQLKRALATLTVEKQVLHRGGNLLVPRRRLAVQHARDEGMSERHAYRLVGQWRTTQRYRPTQMEDEDRLTQSILALASNYGRFGYRRITALLKLAGSRVGKDRVQRIWRSAWRGG